MYATCSILAEENSGVVASFLAQHSSEAVLAAAGPEVALPEDALQLELGLQLLPGSRSGTDGFYYACIEKTTTRR